MTPLRVGTFNLLVIWWPSAPDYERAPLVAGLLAQFDVVGTQEGTTAHLATLTDGTGFARVGGGRDGGDAGEHSAILYRTSRVTLLDSGDFWFSSTPDEPSFGWDALKFRRICTWALFADRETGREFYVFSSHFDHEAEVARAESARLLLAKVREIAGLAPAVVVGDFNAVPGTETMRILLGDGLLADARALCEGTPEGPETTYTNLLAPGDRHRIDWVLLTDDFAVERYAVLDHRPGGHRPSDHDPVLAVVTARRRPWSNDELPLPARHPARLR